MKGYIIVTLLLCFLVAACSADLEGPFLVQRVIDGDTLVLENGKHVRLAGIDTPETGECYYQEAKDRLTELVSNKKIYFDKDYKKKDVYKRELRYIYIDGKNVNYLLVEEGYAEVFDEYRKNINDYGKLKTIEKEAIKRKIGVWNCTSTLI